MNAPLHDLARRLLARGDADLAAADRALLEALAARCAPGAAAPDAFDTRLTRGQRIADHVAAFGGSWTFIGTFVAVLVAWIVLNSTALHFDPYPYILLNLLLSMVAALQAPVIMMSQNRQAAKDRHDAEQDYHVNLQAELEIAALHERIAALRGDELHARLAAIEARLATLAPGERPPA